MLQCIDEWWCNPSHLAVARECSIGECSHAAVSGAAIHYASPGVLEAYDASDVHRPVWSSATNAKRDGLGDWAKFAPPTIAKLSVGRGPTPLPPAPFVPPEQLDALAAHLNLDPFVLVGHSMTTILAQNFAARYPKRVRGIVLCGAMTEQSPAMREAFANQSLDLVEIVKLGIFADLRHLSY